VKLVHLVGFVTKKWKIRFCKFEILIKKEKQKQFMHFFNTKYVQLENDVITRPKHVAAIAHTHLVVWTVTTSVINLKHNRLSNLEKAN
jgi:hypothetical protein